MTTHIFLLIKKELFQATINKKHKYINYYKLVVLVIAILVKDNTESGYKSNNRDDIVIIITLNASNKQISGLISNNRDNAQ